MLWNAEIVALLERTIGLDAESIGPSLIDRAIRERLAACALDDLDAYRQRVSASGEELQALIEAVVVPETWFFRDREAFAGLCRFALDRWLPRHPEGVLRLLSVPCATGEEPYTMAMALIDAGFPMGRCSIDAIDVSAASLERANRAVYGKNSFRGDDLGFRDRHFERTAAGEQLKEAVRWAVRFSQGNLLAADFVSGTTYDAIFCCNLLIYFDRPTQVRAVAALARLLAPEGVLFVGRAEAAALRGSGFTTATVPRGFALPSAALPPVSVAAERPAMPQRLAVPRAASAPAAKPRWPGYPRIAARSPLPSASPQPCDLEHAGRLADQGRLEEAALCCGRYLQTHAFSAPAHHLLGVIRAASGDLASAAAHYRKALYLDPQHPDTLLHFALLLERQGDASGAQRLHMRRRRLEPNGEGR
ncbi:CheR family methyltransferase [Azoarcus sp. KH32C]|uniref:CheR family methyltransferase n=1 Tax=Azoarcus sp. KH32C TaxID=748247 RepID=UPI0002385B97|nr:CheR family methyltransferase [Azoarcus sp. KH32C]BAL27274.1 putative methyltransferase [Azoarcus sp. KH32C]